MTKDEACDAIGVVRNHRYRDGTWTAIRKILDQIGPEPQEFSVRELCELIGKSYAIGSVTVYGDKSSVIVTLFVGNVGCRDIGELKAKMTELSTPPKTKTGMVELPIELITSMANWDGDYSRAAKAALNKLEQQQAK